jgi:hypothetical protein
VHSKNTEEEWQEYVAAVFKMAENVDVFVVMKTVEWGTVLVTGEPENPSVCTPAMADLSVVTCLIVTAFLAPDVDVGTEYMSHTTQSQWNPTTEGVTCTSTCATCSRRRYG